MNFHDNYEVVDPFILYDNIPQPEYLEMDSDDQAIKEYEDSGRGTASPERRYTGKGFGGPAYDQDEESSMM